MMQQMTGRTMRMTMGALAVPTVRAERERVEAERERQSADQSRQREYRALAGWRPRTY